MQITFPELILTNDKLHKVRPLIDDLNKSISGAYSSSICVSIDESMIPFKGRSLLKQYMPMKPVKRGYEVWCIADARWVCLAI